MDDLARRIRREREQVEERVRVHLLRADGQDCGTRSPERRARLIRREADGQLDRPGFRRDVGAARVTFERAKLQRGVRAGAVAEHAELRRRLDHRGARRVGRESAVAG